MLGVTMILLLVSNPGAENSSRAPTVQVDKEIIYKKETTVSFEESQVEGEKSLPPAFFVTKNASPKAKSLLEERLRFRMRNYNQMGF